MRKLVARCVCGAVTQVPEGPVVTRDGYTSDGKTGRCCQCRRVLDATKGYWHNFANVPDPKEQIDLLAIN